MDKKILHRTMALLLAYILLLWVAESVILSIFFPQYTVSSYGAVPVFFALFYASALLIIAKRGGRDKFPALFMVFKMVKLFICLLLLVAGVLLFRSEAKFLLITFLAYYLLMLLPESFFGIYMRHALKRGANE